MRKIEIRVRDLGGFDSSLIVVKLVREAFKPGWGDPSRTAIGLREQVGTMELFAGALGTFKNPPSQAAGRRHRHRGRPDLPQHRHS